MAKPFRLEIAVPNRLDEAIRKDRQLASALGTALDDFSIWLADNKTTFFFDYTDHGIAHVNNVLRSVETLIAEAAWDVLTPDDIVACVSAVLLHDCAMHLTADGFLELISDSWPEQHSRLFADASTWAEEYVRFEQEAARWDAEKLMSVFGDHEPATLVGASTSIEGRQRSLVGEFLRRNHARLAHEISLNGVPGVAALDRFIPFREFDFERKDLYGFLARSHNMPIRVASDHIPKMRRRRLMEVHAPYVMALLRIADYIQIDAARAPTQILQLRGLKSPLSREEWAKHHAVLELNQLGDDPEALVVIADPKSVQVYCGLKALLGDLQRELDESWALLGEIYGPVQELRQLALTVRRVHSNLDDVAAFEAENKPEYVPREIRLTTASAELLHLLVGPLYGNRPVVGVRELLQNALDATLERTAFASQGDDEVGASYEPLIEVELDLATPGGGGALRITDNGVGMSLDTIETYFLRAGASFRRSQWWRAEFTDDSGRSKVRRSGRFGVGALAAFLVGPRMTVTTRNFLEAREFGFKFEISLDNGLVEISRVPAAIGTSINIEITSDTVKDALFRSDERQPGFADWFLYDFPNVSYRLHQAGKWVEAAPRTILECPLVSEASHWTEVTTEGFDGVYWSHVDPVNPSRTDSRRYLACNGIFVSFHSYDSSLPKINIGSNKGPIRIEHPFLLVDDKDGRLPLNVQRSGVVESEYPFQQELETSIAEEFSRNLYLALSLPPKPENYMATLRMFRRRVGTFGVVSQPFIGVSDQGWLPLEPSVLRTSLPKVALLELGSSVDYDGVIPRFDLTRWPGLLCIPCLAEGNGATYTVGFIRSLLQGSSWGRLNPFDPFLTGMVYLRIFVSSSTKEVLAKKTGLPQYLWRMLRVVEDFGDWTIFEYGKRMDAEVADAEWLDVARNAGAKAFAFVYFDQVKAVEALDPSTSQTKFSIAWGGICPTGFAVGRADTVPDIAAWTHMVGEDVEEDRLMPEDASNLNESEEAT